MSENHTAGPWTAGHYSSVVGLPIMAQPDKARDTIIIAGVRGERAVAEANARLIAAAPDLYEAALAAKDFLISDLEEPGRTVFWKLIEALKKAGWTAPDNARARPQS